MNRIKLLQKLIDDRFDKNQAQFARAIKKSPSQVNQWLNGHRAFGDGSARTVEMKLGLPQGYFDGKDDTPGKPDDVSANKVTLDISEKESKPRPEWPFRRISREHWNSLEVWERVCAEEVIVRLLKRLKDAEILLTEGEEESQPVTRERKSSNGT